MTPERSERDSSYAETVAATAAEFDFEREFAEIIVGPDDEHCDDRVASLRVIRDRVCGAWDELVTDNPMDEATKNEFIQLWLVSLPEPRDADDERTLLEIWEGNPMGYVEVMKRTHAHAAFTDEIREGEDPTADYYIA